jgi:predicted hydrocarbon binding protein
MNRNLFLIKGFRYGLCTAGFLPILRSGLNTNLISSYPDCEKKMKFVQDWAKRFIDVVDTKLSKEEGLRLMEFCGRSCFISHQNSGKPVVKMELNDFVEHLKTKWSEEAVTREGEIVFIKYKSKDQPDKCLCPLVNTFPSEISDTFCLCSVGFLKQMFETYTDKRVKVDILETIIGGGNICSFRVELS